MSMFPQLAVGGCTPNPRKLRDDSVKIEKPTIIEAMLPSLQKKRVLIIDNLVETGKTMDMTSNYLNLHGVDTVHTGVLYKKPQSKLKPDYYVATTKAWIIFYFDVVETIKMLGSKWASSGLSMKKIYQNFIHIGLPQDEVDAAMKQIFNYSQ